MYDLFVNSDGTLKTLGYVVSIVSALIIFILASLISKKSQTEKKFNSKQLTFSAISLTLAFVTSYIKVFPLPFGGSVTACSMLFVVIIAYWYGTRAGLLTGFVFGIMQFLQEPYVLSFWQVCCDYLFAFACLGLAGLLAKHKNGLIKGYILGVFCRGLFHTLGGYLFWLDYMPENFPKSIAFAYPFVYNYSYLIAEGIITIILISVPAFKKGFAEITKYATT